MLPKARLTSHSRMSGSRWVITPSWLFGSWRSFLHSSSVYSCHLFLISSASVRSIHTISVLYCAHFCMKCSLDISNFLEEISSLSHSILYLYFFSLFIEEGLISSWYSQVLCIHMGIYFPFSLAFHFSFSLAICKGPSDNHFAFLYFFFFGMILVTASYTMLQISIHCSSGTLSDLIPWICHYRCIIIRDLIQVNPWMA